MERNAERSVNMKIMIALIALAFLAVLSVTAIGISDDSDAEQVNWDIGTPTATDVVATYDTDNKTFTISGTGAMTDWTSSEEGSAPWIASYKNEITTVNIGEGVTNVGNHAFSECSNVATVTLGKDITIIGQYTFNKTALASVTIPNSVVSIGASAFKECASLKTVNLGTGLKTMDQEAFRSTGIESLTIPGNVETIGGSAFNSCSKLATVVLNSGLQTISANAFASSGITTVTIPDTVVTLGTSAFKECKSLTTAVIGSGLNKISDNVFNGCTKLESVTVADSVTSIGTSAFYGCSKLATVTFGTDSGLQTIGKKAFYSCKSLLSITIPDSVTSIGEEAFAQSEKLASVTISANSSLQTIDVAAFKLTALTSFFIPKDVSSIGERFTVNTPISTYTVDSNNQNYCSDDKGVLFNKDKTELIAYPEKGAVSYDIPDTVTTVRAYAFYQSTVQTVGLGKVVTIGTHAFNTCESLTSVTIPATVTTISSRAFGSCSAAHTVAVYTSGNVTSFANDIFDFNFFIGGVEVATDSAEFPGHVYIYNNYTDNMDDSGAARVWDIGATENDSVIASYNGYTEILTISGTGNMMNWTDNAPWSSYVTEIESVVIENGVTSIGDRAFKNCTSLGSMTVPEGIASIGSSAFEGCSILENVTMKSIAVPTLGNNAFNDCSANMMIMVPSESVSAYRTAENWITYADKIFAGITACTVEDIADQPYTGQQITPEVVVKDSTKTLVLGTDYTVEYGDNIDIGEGTVTITGAGIYKGIVEKTFNIVKITPVITVTKTSSCPSGSYNVGATVTSGAALTYEIIAGSDIASIDSAGLITAKAVGTAKLKITSAETATYKAGELTVDITVYDHIHVIVPGTAPTKTATGLTEGEECSECHKVFKEQTSIPATGSEKSVIGSEKSKAVYNVPDSEEIKTLTVGLTDVNKKYTVDLNEESTASVKGKLISFSIESVSKYDDRYSATMTVDGQEFNGTMDITLPYDPSKGTPSVKWIEGNEKMPIVSINETDKTITFTTTHNSTYEVQYPSSSSGAVVGIWIVPAVLFLILICALVYAAVKKD